MNFGSNYKICIMQIRTDEIARTVDDNYYSRFLIIKMNNILRINLFLFIVEHPIRIIRDKNERKKTYALIFK